MRFLTGHNTLQILEDVIYQYDFTLRLKYSICLWYLILYHHILFVCIS